MSEQSLTLSGNVAACSVEGFKRVRQARGWCATHYARWRKHGDVSFTLKPRSAGCKVEGCARKHEARGFCNSHYMRWLRYGDPQHERAVPTFRKGAWQAARYESRRRFLTAIKQTAGCIDCGTSTGRLEFDHRDKGTKSFSVGQGAVSMHRLVAEIEKCDVRCSRCHRRRHTQERRGAA